MCNAYSRFLTENQNKTSVLSRSPIDLRRPVGKRGVAGSIPGRDVYCSLVSRCSQLCGGPCKWNQTWISACSICCFRPTLRLIIHSLCNYYHRIMLCYVNVLLGTFGSLLFNYFNFFIVCLRITDEGSLPEMRIWSILLI